MKGGKPEINIRCSIYVESRLLLDRENVSLSKTKQLMLCGQKKKISVYSESTNYISTMCPESAFC